MNLRQLHHFPWSRRSGISAAPRNGHTCRNRRCLTRSRRWKTTWGSAVWAHEAFAHPDGGGRDAAGTGAAVAVRDREIAATVEHLNSGAAGYFRIELVPTHA